MKSQYSVYEAKAKLSEILRAVKQQRRVTITDRGRPVAEVIPFAGPSSLDDRIEELARGGLITHASEGGSFAPLARKPGALRRFLDERD